MAFRRSGVRLPLPPPDFTRIFGHLGWKCGFLLGKGYGVPRNRTPHEGRPVRHGRHPKSECVLFEDALYALKGGREAGLLGEVAVAEPLYEPFRAEIRAIADVFVDSLAELV